MATEKKKVDQLCEMVEVQEAFAHFGKEKLMELGGLISDRVTYTTLDIMAATSGELNYIPQLFKDRVAGEVKDAELKAIVAQWGDTEVYYYLRLAVSALTQFIKERQEA